MFYETKLFMRLIVMVSGILKFWFYIRYHKDFTLPIRMVRYLGCFETLEDQGRERGNQPGCGVAIPHLNADMNGTFYKRLELTV